MPQQPRTEQALTIVAVSYDSPAARELTRALHAEQSAVYGRADDPEATEPADFASPNGAFFAVARADGTALACGGWRTAAETTAEIKRMYVTPSVRGRGVGRQLLAALESDARRRGMSDVILETGVRNLAAMALYTDCGYAPAAPYVAGRDPRINRALRKALVTAPAGGERWFRERPGFPRLCEIPRVVRRSGA